MAACEARPWGSAERSPEAMMVSNDISCAPAWRAAYSISAATSASRTPGRMTSSARSKRLAPRSTAARMRAISSSSFTMRARSIRAGPRADGSPTAERRQSDRAATVICSPSMPIFERARRPFFWCSDSQRCGCRERPFASDHDLRRLHFGSRLLGVAPIGEEHRFFSVRTKSSGAAGESAEIAKIGRMGDQQRVQTMGGKRILQTLLTALWSMPGV